MQLHVKRMRLCTDSTVPRRGRIAIKCHRYHRLMLPIVKFLEVMPKSCIVVLFLIQYITSLGTAAWIVGRRE